MNIQAIVEDAVRELARVRKPEIEVKLAYSDFSALLAAKESSWFQSRSAQLYREGKLIRFLRMGGVTP